MLLAVTGGRLALIAPDVEQRDAASKAHELLGHTSSAGITEAAAEGRGAGTEAGAIVQFLCHDAASGRAVAATSRPVSLEPPPPPTSSPEPTAVAAVADELM